MDIDHPLKGSICNLCKFQVLRIIAPASKDEEFFNNIIGDEDFDDAEEIIFEHYMCKKLHIDLDHIVIECSEFKHKNNNNLTGLFNNDFFK